MATRPVVPLDAAPCAAVRPVAFQWFPGFLLAQKQRCIAALHGAAREALGVGSILEASSRSPEPLGVALSALNLAAPLAAYTTHAGCAADGPVSVGCAFQGSKVFQAGGPYHDPCRATPRGAKGDGRPRASGACRRPRRLPCNSHATRSPTSSSTPPARSTARPARWPSTRCPRGRGNWRRRWGRASGSSRSKRRQRP